MEQFTQRVFGLPSRDFFPKHFQILQDLRQAHSLMPHASCHLRHLMYNRTYIRALFFSPSHETHHTLSLSFSLPHRSDKHTLTPTLTHIHTGRHMLTPNVLLSHAQKLAQSAEEHMDSILPVGGSQVSGATCICGGVRTSVN